MYKMEDYNRLISSRILDGYEEMLDTVPQPQMLGGKRMRNFVLPGSTEYDLPGTLSVGTMDGKRPATLAGAFYKDFNRGFPADDVEDLAGGAMCHPGNPRRVGGSKIGKSLKKAFTKAGDVGKSSAFALNKALKSSPVSRAVVYNVAPELAGEAVKAAVTYQTGNPALGKAAAKGASSGTKAGLKSEGYGKGRGKKVGADPRTYTPKHLLTKGGALIRDEPSQFHSSVYPPALASYRHQFPMHDAYGRGRDAAPKPKRKSARGAIVAEVMKKHGLSLAEASKYVKEKGLY